MIAYINIKIDSDHLESNIKVVQDKIQSGRGIRMGVACDKDDIVPSPNDRFERNQFWDIWGRRF